MATVRKWSGVAVAMQSALAAADTISGITKANPGVVTATAHGMSNGAFVLLAIQGMHQLNGRVARIANVTSNTYELEGIDTSAFDTFSTGSCQEITFGTTISTAAGISASGGDFDFVDTTTIHDNVKSQIPGVSNPLTYTMDHNWDAADAGQVAMKAASDAQAQRAFRFTFGTGGPIMAFAGYVGFSGAPTGTAQDKVISPAVITAFGRPSYYAS